MVLGTPGERLAEQLLRNPDRLLSAVLFWNLLVNILYFAIATMVSTRWEGQPTLSAVFTIGSLIAIIFFSEMLPKSVGVLNARAAAGFVGVPMTVAVRALDPLMPGLRTVNTLSRRLIWPGLEETPHLESRDLERAIELSQSESDAERGDNEKIMLRNIVQLSNLQAQEWMRPRKTIQAFRPPVAASDLKGRDAPSGYLLISDQDGDEITSALDLSEFTGTSTHHLDRLARPVAFVPWCAPISQVLEVLRKQTAQVASVVNERGETIGIVTLNDILDAVLTEDPHRGQLLLNRRTVLEQSDGTWHVDGMTNVRRLHNLTDAELPPSRNVTVGGVVQETLEQLPQVGDTCEWGPFDIRVLEITEETGLLLSLALRDLTEESE